MKYTIASGPVIIRNHKILLVKTKKDPFWKFPGGRVKPKETLEQTAIREAKEEVGLKVRPLKPLKPLVIYRKNEIFVSIAYLAAAQGKIKLGREVEKYSWFLLKKLPRPLGENIKPVIQTYLKEKK